MTQNAYTEQEWHLKQGVAIFDETLANLELEDPSDEEVFLMIHGAHASRYHFTKIGHMEDIARAEWLVSRVYAQVGMGDQALLHAQYSFDLCEDNKIIGMVHANACEAIARAALLLKDEDLYEGYYRMASDAAKAIENPREKSHFLDGLKALKQAY